MRVCILDAWAGGDEALTNSHQVALWSEATLREHGVAVATIAGDAVTRTRVEAALATPDHDGFAYFGHGAERCLFRTLDATHAPVALVDDANLSPLGERWFHAFACLSGRGLGISTTAEAVGCYVGYAVKVNVGWTDEALTDPLRPLLIALTTCATRLLASGERSRDALRRAVREVSDALVAWLDEHPEEAEALPHGEQLALYQLANTLHERMTVAGASVRP